MLVRVCRFLLKQPIIKQLPCVQQEGAPFALIWPEFLPVIDLKKQKPRILNFQRTRTLGLISVWREWVFWKIIAGKGNRLKQIWWYYSDNYKVSKTDYKTSIQIFDSGLRIYFKKVVYSLQPVWSRVTRNRMWAMS